VLLDKKEISLYIIRKEIPHQSVYYISLSLSTFYYILLLVRRLYPRLKRSSLLLDRSRANRRGATQQLASRFRPAAAAAVRSRDIYLKGNSI
jgi:hypothetical protein